MRGRSVPAVDPLERAQITPNARNLGPGDALVVVLRTGVTISGSASAAQWLDRHATSMLDRSEPDGQRLRRRTLPGELGQQRFHIARREYGMTSVSS